MSQIRRLSSTNSRTRVRVEDPPWLAADWDRRGKEAPFHSSCCTFIETAGIGELDYSFGFTDGDVDDADSIHAIASNTQLEFLDGGSLGLDRNDARLRAAVCNRSAKISAICSNAYNDSLGQFTHPAHDEVHEAWLPDSEPVQIPLNQFAGIPSNKKPLTLETPLS